MEAIRIAFNSLLVNRLRALLTTLGIIIGVGSVIGLISLGRGVQDFIASEFADLGSNLLVVFASPPKSPTRERIEPLTTIEALEMVSLPEISLIAPIHGLQGNIVYGRENIPGQLSYGVTPSYVDVRNYTPVFGRWFTQADIDDKARVVVLGWGVAEELFGELDDGAIDPTGELVRYLDTPFEVIGVMEETSALAGENNILFLPISTSQQRLAPPFRARTRDGGYFLDAIYLQAASEDAMDQAAIAIEQYLMDAHNIQFDGEQDFTIVNQSDLLESLNGITNNLTIFLSLIASTSLLVGGIGIMNIMLVSVTERTREIGIRKAIGAKQSDILAQFLTESIVLSLLGGFLGIMVGFLIAFLGTTLVTQLTLSVRPDSIALATTVSVMVGVFFGFYPAWQAARKNPIDALRFE
jgi:putative ABC transport system permease protein